ncbi:hypothetical protein GMES_1535 [Paraglaciecola mesophila KMM 241]|uniref:Uncharacterized protein n=1 Tax=Paraglaciecola mesophila KMM 241 TaxID=1128912 RepID=K6YIN3_9ALTE|nr:hypothetical protein GMES_1535 [Paraglaciecola mesophila KMM 241]
MYIPATTELFSGLLNLKSLLSACQFQLASVDSRSQYENRITRE